MANKRRPQGDGTIRKRSDGRWEARIIIGHKNDGSPMYKSAFAKTQKSALKQLHQLLDLYRDVDLTEECRMTLGEWMDKWLDEYMIFTVRESTLDSYRCLTENQVKRFIGEKQLSSLTTAECHSAIFGEVNISVKVEKLVELLEGTLLRLCECRLIHG